MLRLTGKQAQALLTSSQKGRLPKNKFHAKATVVDGVRFASKAEAARWAALQRLEAAGIISMLRRQVPVKLMIGDRLISTIIWDASYVRDSKMIYEDVKGAMKTHAYRLYALKRNLFLALYPNVEVVEVIRGKETRHR